METLIKTNNSTERWYPQRVEKFISSINIVSDDLYRLKRNFAYNMQYIEYLEKQIDELKLSEVLATMLYKSYIITGMGIIELIFSCLLKSNGLWKTTEWQECSEFVANPKTINGETIKVVTTLLKKVPVYDMRMDLDSMIKKVEKKNVLTIQHHVFPALKRLRELRNRVHLQLGEGEYDHDYNSIGFDEIQMMRRILYTILTVPEICNDETAFEFIKIAYNKYKRSIQE